KDSEGVPTERPRSVRQPQVMLREDHRYHVDKNNLLGVITPARAFPWQDATRNAPCYIYKALSS
ncbi:MAG: hypothetical protein U9Q82_15535, partial [Chloroflexota bacterium]|nr:hypothetical protein [Chloroflexota bacterium]